MAATKTVRNQQNLPQISGCSSPKAPAACTDAAECRQRQPVSTTCAHFNPLLSPHPSLPPSG
jgi:hypothetical protein